MEEKFSLAASDIELDAFGRVVIKNDAIKTKLEDMVNLGDLVASNQCSNTGACGTAVNAGGCGNTVNGSCSASFLNSEEIIFEDDSVIFTNPGFNTNILNSKLENIENIKLEFKAFKNA